MRPQKACGFKPDGTLTDADGNHTPEFRERPREWTNEQRSTIADACIEWLNERRGFRRVTVDSPWERPPAGAQDPGRRSRMTEEDVMYHLRGHSGIFPKLLP
jgi:hypothetical protein